MCVCVCVCVCVLEDMVYEDTNVYNDVYYNVNMVPDVTSCEIRPPPPCSSEIHLMSGFRFSNS